MSQENVELVRRGHEAFRDSGEEAIFEYLHADIDMTLARRTARCRDVPRPRRRSPLLSAAARSLRRLRMGTAGVPGSGRPRHRRHALLRCGARQRRPGGSDDLQRLDRPAREGRPSTRLSESLGCPRSRRAVGVGDVGGERGERADDVGCVDGRSRRDSTFRCWPRTSSTRTTSCPTTAARPITVTTESGGPGLAPSSRLRMPKTSSSGLGTGRAGGFLPPLRGRGTASAIEVEFRCAYLWRFEGGKVVYLKSVAIPSKPSQPPGCRSRRGVQSEQSLVAPKGVTPGSTRPAASLRSTRSSARRSAPSLVKIGKLEASRGPGRDRDATELRRPPGPTDGGRRDDPPSASTTCGSKWCLVVGEFGEPPCRSRQGCWRIPCADETGWSMLGSRDERTRAVADRALRARFSRWERDDELPAQKPLELILARNLLTSLSTPAFLVDDEAALVFYNEAAAAVLGRSFEDAGRMTAEQWTAAFGPFDQERRARSRSTARDHRGDPRGPPRARQFTIRAAERASGLDRGERVPDRRLGAGFLGGDGPLLAAGGERGRADEGQGLGARGSVPRPGRT